jgi:hypothetical protein
MVNESLTHVAPGPACAAALRDPEYCALHRKNPGGRIALMQR